MFFSRRDFGRMALSSLAVSPFTLRSAQAAPASAERKFLFIFARGGWDFSYVFAPLFDNSWVDGDPESTAAEAHGLPFVDAESRPAVREFFENYGDRACIINGMEVRSITHSVCTRLLFTGTSGVNADDFGSILAAHSGQDLLLPHMILSGPSYGYQYSSQMVRMGPDGQLLNLLDGSSMDHIGLESDLPGNESQAVIEAYIRDRAEVSRDADRPGWVGRSQSLQHQALDQLHQLEAGGVDLAFSSSGLSGQIADAMTLLSLGLSRCVTVQHDGLYDMGWDSHSTNSHQDSHFQLFFEVVNETMASLDSLTSVSGRPLADEVTVVLISEMGRDPRLNAQEGKHHWTHTSCMVVGAGIEGGQVLGAYDENVSSSPVDLATGEVQADGTYLLPAHLGATLLAMGDVDSVPYLGDVQPIMAVLK